MTESRSTLKDLEIVTLQILSAASRYEYSEQDIMKKISFVMTDSTYNNLKVTELVCAELKVPEVPKTLLCNAHPLMMFQSKTNNMIIHNGLGNRKIDECFLVPVAFRHKNFVQKSIQCLSNFRILGKTLKQIYNIY